MSERIVNCPRCFEQCGWCSDFRHMHGTLSMPGDKKNRRCDIPAMAPEGGDCPICAGAMKVVETRTYTKLPKQEPTNG